MRTLTQTVLPFKVEATEEMLTANAGVALLQFQSRILGQNQIPLWTFQIAAPKTQMSVLSGKGSRRLAVNFAEARITTPFLGKF